MAHEEDHGKTPAELEARVWHLAQKIQFALFTSWDGNRMAQWPLTAHVDKEARTFSFLVDQKSDRYRLLDQYPEVLLGFVDGTTNVVIAGHGSIRDDRAKIQELWSAFDKAWWDSPEDPSIRLLTVEPDRAELWDSPNQLIAAAVMLTAAVTGAKPAVGDHGTVSM